jgi:hypothetical protein
MLHFIFGSKICCPRAFTVCPNEQISHLGVVSSGHKRSWYGDAVLLMSLMFVVKDKSAILDIVHLIFFFRRMYVCLYVCKGWAKIYRALAHRPLRSIVLLLKGSISETRSVWVVRCRGSEAPCLGPLERARLDQQRNVMCEMFQRCGRYW